MGQIGIAQVAQVIAGHRKNRLDLINREIVDRGDVPEFLHQSCLIGAARRLRKAFPARTPENLIYYNLKDGRPPPGGEAEKCSAIFGWGEILPRSKSCKFCAIVAGAENAFSVFRDELCIGFLDYRPLALGHVLLVPVDHFPVLEDVPDEVIAGIGIRIKRISAGVIAAMSAGGSFIALNNRISQSVPHVHFHIVPRNRGDGLFAQRMIWKRVSYRDDAQRREIAGKIRAAIPPAP